MASVPSWSFKSFCLKEHLVCKMVSCGGGTALLFLSSVRTYPSHCSVRDEQAPLIAVAHLDELESQSLASWEYSLITLLTLLLIKTTKHYFLKSSCMWHVCAYVYVYPYVWGVACVLLAQVGGQGTTWSFRPHFPLCLRQGLFVICVVYTQTVWWVFSSLSPTSL